MDMWTIGLCPNACAFPASMLKAGKCSASPTYPPAPTTNHFFKLDLKEGEGAGEFLASSVSFPHPGKDSRPAPPYAPQHRRPFLFLPAAMFIALPNYLFKWPMRIVCHCPYYIEAAYACPDSGAVETPLCNLIKIGAKVVRHGRYVTFQMAEVAVPRRLFAEILSLIARLQAPPAPA